MLPERVGETTAHPVVWDSTWGSARQQNKSRSHWPRTKQFAVFLPEITIQCMILRYRMGLASTIIYPIIQVDSIYGTVMNCEERIKLPLRQNFIPGRLGLGLVGEVCLRGDTAHTGN